MSADQHIAAHHERGDRVNSELGASLPVRIHGLLVAPADERLHRLVGREADALGDPDQDLGLGDIFRLDQVGAENRIVDFVTLAFAFGPFRQLLRQAAVIGHIPLAVVGQPLLLHQGFHAHVPGGSGAAAFPFLGGVGMKRKVGESNLQTVIVSEFLNTPGTEIAPGSDIVRKNF